MNGKLRSNYSSHHLFSNSKKQGSDSFCSSPGENTPIKKRAFSKPSSAASSCADLVNESKQMANEIKMQLNKYKELSKTLVVYSNKTTPRNKQTKKNTYQNSFTFNGQQPSLIPNSSYTQELESKIPFKNSQSRVYNQQRTKSPNSSGRKRYENSSEKKKKIPGFKPFGCFINENDSSLIPKFPNCEAITNLFKKHKEIIESSTHSAMRNEALPANKKTFEKSDEKLKSPYRNWEEYSSNKEQALLTPNPQPNPNPIQKTDLESVTNVQLQQDLQILLEKAQKQINNNPNWNRQSPNLSAKPHKKSRHAYQSHSANITPSPSFKFDLDNRDNGNSQRKSKEREKERSSSAKKCQQFNYSQNSDKKISHYSNNSMNPQKNQSNIDPNSNSLSNSLSHPKSPKISKKPTPIKFSAPTSKSKPNSASNSSKLGKILKNIKCEQITNPPTLSEKDPTLEHHNLIEIQPNKCLSTHKASSSQLKELKQNCKNISTITNISNISNISNSSNYSTHTHSTHAKLKAKPHSQPKYSNNTSISYDNNINNIKNSNNGSNGRNGRTASIGRKGKDKDKDKEKESNHVNTINQTNVICKMEDLNNYSFIQKEQMIKQIHGELKGKLSFFTTASPPPDFTNPDGKCLCEPKESHDPECACEGKCNCVGDENAELMKTMRQDLEKWRQFGYLLAESYDELKTQQKKLVEEKERDRKIIAALKEQVNKIKQLLHHSNQENENLREELATEHSIREQFISTKEKYQALKEENSQLKKYTTASDEEKKMLINEKEMTSKIVQQLNSKIKKLKHEQEKQTEEDRRGKRCLNESGTSIAEELSERKAVFYKKLSERHLEESSTLADQLICLRTDMDKPHSQYQKMQRQNSSADSLLINQSNININMNDSLSQPPSQNQNQNQCHPHQTHSNTSLTDSSRPCTPNPNSGNAGSVGAAAQNRSHNQKDALFYRNLSLNSHSSLTSIKSLSPALPPCLHLVNQNQSQSKGLRKSVHTANPSLHLEQRERDASSFCSNESVGGNLNASHSPSAASASGVHGEFSKANERKNFKNVLELGIRNKSKSANVSKHNTGFNSQSHTHSNSKVAFDQILPSSTLSSNSVIVEENKVATFQRKLSSPQFSKVTQDNYSSQRSSKLKNQEKSKKNRRDIYREMCDSERKEDSSCENSCPQPISVNPPMMKQNMTFNHQIQSQNAYYSDSGFETQYDKRKRSSSSSVNLKSVPQFAKLNKSFHKKNSVPVREFGTLSNKKERKSERKGVNVSDGNILIQEKYVKLNKPPKIPHFSLNSKN